VLGRKESFDANHLVPIYLQYISPIAMGYKILLVDDHRLMRMGLRSLLLGIAGMEVVGEAENGRLAVVLAQQLRPELIIMDVDMPELNGIEATRQILAQLPATKIIALSMHSEDRLVSSMLKAGAAGYLLKHSAAEELERAIHTVMAQQNYLSPDVTHIVVKALVERADPAQDPPRKDLSAREREILQLLSEGFSVKEIAARLQLSIKTIETHRQRIMDRLQLHTVAELTKYAVREGLTSLG
jgi:DNA-binding NarL/FixJ family response regulator